MGNTQLLSDIVDDSAFKQIEDLKKQLSDLGVTFNATAKQATDFYKTTGNSTGPSALTKANKDASAAIDELAANQQKQLQIQKQLQAEQDKAIQKQIQQRKQQEQAIQKEADLLAKAQAKQRADDDKTTQQEIKNSQARERQANKEAFAKAKANRPYNKAVAARNDARKNYEDTALSQGVDSQAAKDALDNFNKYQQKLDEVNEKTGNFRDKVGGYTASLTGFFGKAFSSIRTLAYILPGIGIAGIFSLIGEGIVAIVQKLGLFESSIYTLDTFKLKLQSIASAVSSGTFQDGIKNVQQLGVNLKLAQDGFIDKDKVIDEYNKTIGVTAGRVDTLTQAEKGFQENSKDYINALLQQAYAQAVMADTAKDVASVVSDNFKLQQSIIANQRIIDENTGKRKRDKNANPSDYEGATQYVTASTVEEDIKRREKTNKDLQAEIDKNNASLQKRYDKRTEILNDVSKKLVGTTGAGLGQDAGGISDEAKLRADVANKELEIDKQLQQNILSNDKNSFDAKIAAAKKYGDDDLAIAKNNNALATSEKKLSDLQKINLEKEYQLQRLTIITATETKIRELRDQSFRESLKNADATEGQITTDPNSTYQQKLDAITDFEDKSYHLIVKARKDRVISQQEEGTLISDIEKKKNTEILKINKEAQAELLKLFKEGLKGQEDAENESLINLRDANNSKILSIDKYKSDAISSVTDEYQQRKITASKYNYEVAKIEFDAQKQRVDSQIDTQKQIIDTQKEYLKFGIGSAKELQRAQDELTKLEISADDLVTKRKLDNIKQLEEARKNLQGLETQAISASIDLVKQLVDGGYQKQLDALKAQSDQISANADIEKAAINDSLASSKSKADQNALIDARAKADQDRIAAQQKQIKQKEAKFDKAISLAKVVQATSTAEVQALTYLSNPLTAPLYPAIAALIGAIGAVELATIVATPIPQYAKGTSSAKGGLSLVGELGKEFVRTPTGQVFFTPSTPTLMDIPKGSEVLTAMETKRLQNAGAIPKSEKDIALLNEVKRGNDILAKNKPKQPRVSGWMSEQSAMASQRDYERRIFY